MAEWRKIHSGERIPQDAVLGSQQTKWGDLYIGHVDGQIGRITIKTEGIAGPQQVRRMDRFTYHGDHSWSGKSDCLILCAPVGTASWVPIKKGDRIPATAVSAAVTPKDGMTWVAKCSENEDYKGDIGKVNTDKDLMYNFWCQSRAWSGCQEASLLVLQSPVVASVVARPVQPPAPAPQPVAVVTPSEVQRPQPIARVAPAAPSSFPTLHDLPIEKMNNLKANPELVDDWLADHSEVRKLKGEARELRSEQEGIAYEVLAMESDFDNAQRVYEYDACILASAQSRVQRLQGESQIILQKQSPEELGRALNACAESADAQAENSFQSALSQPALDSQKLAEFRRSYIAHKAEMHKRLALSDRLKRVNGAPSA